MDESMTSEQLSQLAALLEMALDDEMSRRYVKTIKGVSKTHTWSTDFMRALDHVKDAQEEQT